MKFIINLFLLTVLLSQNMSETVSGNKIKFTNFTNKNSGEFIVLPKQDFKILQISGLKFEKAFTKRNNVYYEVIVSSDNNILELDFNKDLSKFQRGDKDMSLNRLFFDYSEFNKRKNNKVVSNSYLTDDKSLKLTTLEKGVYKLTYSYFTDNLIEISDLFTSRMKLFSKGKEIPIFIESGNNEFIDKKNEYILFYADINKNTKFVSSEDIYENPYDKHNIFWLISSSDEKPGLRLFLKNGLNIEKDEDLIYTPQFFTTKKHFEKNNLLGTKYIPRVEAEYSNKGFFHHRDFYFWAPTIKNDRFYAYDLADLGDVHITQNDSVEFEVMMSGSAGNYTGPHGVEFKISKGSVIKEDFNWRHSYKNKLSFKIPYSFMRAIDNTFEAKAVYDNDLLLMNWMNVKYNRKFIAKDNFLEFSAIKSDPHPIIGKAYSVYEYEIKNLFAKNFFILKKNEAIISNFNIVKQQDGTSTVIFQDEIENENSEFIIINATSFKEPLDIKLNSTLNNSSLKNTISDAEMLILAPEIYLDKAEEYAEYKNTFLKSKVIPVEAIYNEFNFGNESPVAIKEFLKYAYENWSPENTLKYVLILGDAIRDYKKGNDENYIVPTFQFISQKFGYVTSDAFYGYLYHSDEYLVDFNNNPISDLYIGRVPAENISELDSYLSKMKEYEESNTQEKNLFLSGNDFNPGVGNREIYTNKRVFLGQNARMNNTNETHSKFNLMRRASDDPINETNTVLQGTDDLIKIFNEGVNYISFLGHGAGAVWGDRNIMLQEDVQKLQNKNKYPLISSFTCFIGAFDGGRTMGEELVLQRNVGAIGVLGSSGVSLLYNQYMFGYYINEYVFQNKYSYGEALSLGKYKYYRKGGNYITDTDLLSTPEHSIHKTLLLMEFNYLGDPSIRIKFPDELDVEMANNLVRSDDNYEFTLNNIEPNTYTATYHFIDYFGETLFSKDTILEINNQLSLEFDSESLTNEEVYYLKGSLKSSDKVYNFGKKLYKDSYLDLEEVTVIDPNTLNEVVLNTNNDFKLKFVSSQKVAEMTATIKLYRYDQTRFDRYRLTFSSNDSTNFISKEVFRVSKDISDMDITEIKAKKNAIALAYRNNSLKVTPTKYVISPIKNSLKVDYNKNTNIAVTVAYPLSFVDTLDVYADYFRVELDSIYYLGKDTVHFYQTNTNKVSKLAVTEDYLGQYSKYRIRFYTDNLELELDSINQIIDTDWTNIPNAFLKSNIQNTFIFDINPEINLRVNLALNNFSNSKENTIIKIDYKDINNEINPNYNNILDDKIIEVNYFNENLELVNLDTTSFHLRLNKNVWKDFDSEKISIVYFDKGIEEWLDNQSSVEINSDSTLIIKSAKAFSLSQDYAVVEFNSNIKYQVDVNFEIDGVKSDSIQFTSLNPKIKINLLSQSESYVLNPDNIVLTHRKDNGAESEILFSHSYSGINKNNLNIILDGSSNFNEDGNYRINVKVGGFTQLYRVLDGNREVLLNNEMSQRLNISGSDNMTVYGNFPNPFGRKTIFPIQLSSSSNNNLSLKIKIYSLSGLLVKTISEDNMLFANTANNASLYGEDITGDIKIGMNYVAWDGYSKNGEELANGVYFAKMIYKTNNKTIEKIIKIAKLKGYN